MKSSLRTPVQRAVSAVAEPFARLDFALNTRATRRLIQHGPEGRPFHVAADRWQGRRFERSSDRAAQRDRIQQAPDVSELVTRAGEALFANQKWAEIVPFLEFVRAAAPRAVLEIGVAGGGTNLLLSHAHPNVGFVGAIDLYVRNKAQLSYFAPTGQERLFLDASSYDPQTVRAVSSALGERKLDLLFIDGDHSYDGARRDFEAYTPLVRRGGIIAFHDIVPDEVTRTGTFTGNWVGEVPVLWEDIKRSYPDWREFVADSDQDGYGIGVISFDDQVVPTFSR
jgi:predicted O-methyltransferase YrrM